MATTIETMVDEFNKMVARITTMVDKKQDKLVPALRADKLTVIRAVVVSGDATATAQFDGTEDLNLTLALKNTGVPAGVYCKVNVNAKGLVTGYGPLLASDIPVLNQNTLGNAETATALLNPRKINDVVFSGSSDIVIYDNTKIPMALFGAANGVATLDILGKIPSSQLPSYVDDVLEYPTRAEFTPVGEAGKIYVALDTNQTYRWGGTAYIHIAESPVISVAGRIGAVLLTKADVGLANAEDTADSVKNVATAGKLATARTLTWIGDVVGGTLFDGSAGVVVTMSLPLTGVTPGVYSKVTVTDKGLVTAGAALLPADVPVLNQNTTGNAATATALATTRAITLAGAVTGTVNFNGSANVSIATTLANSGAVAGSYPKVTVNAKGIVTAGLSLLASDIPLLNQNTAGVAAFATKLFTARTINGVAFDGTANITVTDDTKIATSLLGAANGVATLDVTGKVPASQLPSYVDDVLEYADIVSLPVTGDTAKIYVTVDDNQIYRWSGSAYINIATSPVTMVAGRTGVVTLNKVDVGLDNVDNTADAMKDVLSATKLTTARNITLTGDITGAVAFNGSANVSILSTLANTGVTAGTYAKVTVDAKGRVTSGANLVASDVPTLNQNTTGNAATATQAVSASKLTTGRNISLVGDFNGSFVFDGSTDLTLPITFSDTGVIAGTYAKVTVDSKGRVTLGSGLVAGDIPLLNQNTSGNAGTATALQTARTINGVAFNGTGNITISDNTKIATSLIGAVNGVAGLDATGKVPTAQLPSYVDDIVEFATLSVFPGTGESGKIYIDLSNNKAYRWSGSVYVNVFGSPVDSVAGRTGSVLLTKSDVGLNNVDNTSDVTKAVLSATKLATSRAIAITGDLSGSANFDGSAGISIPIALATTGVAAGTYAKVTVDAKGRVTAGSALVANDIPPLDISDITTGILPIAQGGTGANGQVQALLNLGVGSMATRNVTISTAAPLAANGLDGDIWLQYV